MMQTFSSASWGFASWRRLNEGRPILTTRAESTFRCPVRGERVHWEAKDVFNPAAVVSDGKVWLLYRAEDTVGRFAGTSRVGLAVSEDGVNFQRAAEPVLYPQRDGLFDLEWEGGCEDARVVQDESGRWIMTYTAYNGHKPILCVAHAADLAGPWTKTGPAFANSRYATRATKSGSIVTQKQGDRLVAVRIDGHYWMYFGEGEVFGATSDDLLHWIPIEGNFGHDKTFDYRDGRVIQKVNNQYARTDLRPVLGRRRHRFDSSLVEPGPPAVLTEAGIVLLYNGANNPHWGDATLTPGGYTPGQALFDRRDPMCLIRRCEGPVLTQSKLEAVGQFNGVCFFEGLVWFKGRWIAYFGSADSAISAAECVECHVD